MTVTIKKLKHRAAELLQSPCPTNQDIDVMNETAWQLRNADVALVAKLSAKALQLSARNDYTRGRAFALRNLGACQFRTDQYKAAELSYEESRRLFLYLHDIAGLASAFNGLGAAKRQMGEYEAALEHHSAALRLSEKLKDHEGIFPVLLSFSAVHWHLTDYSQSLEYVYRGLQMAINSKSDFNQAHAYYALVDILWRVGEAAEAITCSEKALALLEAHQNRRVEGMILCNLGAARQSLGEYEKALGNYQQSYRISQAVGNVDTQVEVKIGIGSIYCETNELKQALMHLFEALSLSQNIGHRFYESRALLQLGNAYRQAGDERESLQMLEQALEISEKLNIKEVGYKAHLSLSKSYQAQGNPLAALHHYQSFHQIWTQCHGTEFGRKIERLLLEHKRAGYAPSEMRHLLYQTVERGDYGKTDSQPAASPALPPRKFKEVVEFIDRHLEQNLSVEDLSDLVGLSQRYFLRLFKASSGVTPHQFLVERRIERAKSLLSSTNLPITEVASQCGFSSQSHLNTHFRLQTGQTPNQFRQLINGNQARLRLEK